jgi:hypothetical protein
MNWNWSLIGTTVLGALSKCAALGAVISTLALAPHNGMRCGDLGRRVLGTPSTEDCMNALNFSSQGPLEDVAFRGFVGALIGGAIGAAIWKSQQPSRQP